MNSKKILQELKKQYPGKNITVNDEKKPTEIICEIEPTSLHPGHSLAVTVVDLIPEHFHKKSAEIYYVAKGKLVLQINGKQLVLNENEWSVVQPGEVHSGKGEETWVYVYSEPGWSKNDHYLTSKDKETVDKLSFNFSRNIILTSRFKEMLEFYQQILGFQIKSINQDRSRAELVSENLTLSLIDKEKFLKINNLASKQILSFRVDSLDYAYKQLEKKGINFFKKPNLILDPDGNVIHIFDNPLD